MNRRKFAAAASAALVTPHVLHGRSAWSAQMSTPASEIADVPMFRGDAAHTGLMPGPAPRGEPNLLWQIATGDDDMRSSPVVAGGLVYVMSDEGVLHALDLFTGAERWRATILGTYQGSGPLTFHESTPAIVNGVLYASGWPDFVALDAASSEELWRVANAGGGSPTVVDGIVYVLDGTRLSAFDAATGERAWRFSGWKPGSPLHFGSADPAVTDGVVYAGVGQVLHAIDAANGQERWQFDTGFSLYSSPAVADGTVFFGSGSLAGGPEAPMGHVYALDAETGAERWRLAEDGPFWPSPAVADGTVYIGAGLPSYILGEPSVGALYALDATDGSVRWKAPTGHITSSAAIVDDVVYTGAETEPGTTGAVVRGFDGVSGAEVWRAELWTSFQMRAEGFSSPAVTGGVLLVGGGTTPALYAIGGE